MNGKRKDIQFAFVGDIMLGGEFLSFAEGRGVDMLAPFNLIDSYLKDADIVIGNLEGPIFEGEKKRKEVATLLSNHLSLLNYLKQFRLCVMNLGNNHIMDCGAEGLYETMNCLIKGGIYMVGAGTDCEQAERELVVEVNGVRVGFLSYTSDEVHIRSVIATKDKPGCASYLNSKKMVQRVRELKEAVNVVCVSMHWGYEYFTYPSLEQVNIAHSLIDAGATYVIGHHPHVIQGIERYRCGLIIYSLGDYFFPSLRTTSGRIQCKKPLTRELMVIKSKCHGDGSVSFQTIGGKVSRDYVVTPINEEGQLAFVSKVEKLSVPIRGEDYGQFWEIYEKSRRWGLEKESLMEAFKKLVLTPKRELVKGLSAEDVWRNLRRVRKMIVKKN